MFNAAVSQTTSQKWILADEREELLKLQTCECVRLWLCVLNPSEITCLQWTWRQLQRSSYLSWWVHFYDKQVIFGVCSLWKTQTHLRGAVGMSVSAAQKDVSLEEIDRSQPQSCSLLTSDLWPLCAAAAWKQIFITGITRRNNTVINTLTSDEFNTFCLRYWGVTQLNISTHLLSS